MYRILVLYAVSGFVSLGYQVTWFRIFNDWFGSTTLSFALVVCNFIAGLGLGALCSRAISRWISIRCALDDRIRVYGVVEVLVGATALLTVLLQQFPGDLFGSFPYVQTAEGFWRPTLAVHAFQTAAAIICVAIPCIFMGVTFPLICHAFVDAARCERFPSSLYAWNTLGACAGVLACQYVLIPEIGHGPTFWSMAAANILLGAYFLVTGAAGAVARKPDDDETVAAAEPASSASDPECADPGALLAFAIVSGLIAGALEGDLFKRIGFSLGGNPGATMSFISLWAILGIFAASATVRRFPQLRIGTIQGAFIAALALYLLAGQLHVIDGTMEWVHRYVLPISRPEFLPFEFRGSSAFPDNLTQLLVFIGIIVFPPFYLVSLLLPYVCNRAQAQGIHLGRLYGSNTLAFCIGLVGFTLIAPHFNIFYSTKLFYALFALATLQLCLLRENRRPPGWQPIAAVAAFAVSCALTPSDFDRSYFHPTTDPFDWEISALKSEASATTFIASAPGIRILFFGRLNMTATNMRANGYMRLMAHVPLLTQEAPRNALLICFGVGNTASAIAAHESIESIDAVDLNANVFRTAPEFEASNDGVYEDPRIRLIHDDGRRFLRTTNRRYDLITSEPPPPMAAGTYRLYSREYYRDALDHLTPTGVMSQWLPVYQMPEEAVGMAVQTFTDVFPHTLMFSGWLNDFILLGSASPIDLRLLERNFAAMPEHTATELLRSQVRDVIALLGRIVAGDAGLRSDFWAKRIISDQHNDLDHLMLTPRPRDGVPYRPSAVYEDLDMASLEAGAELRDVMFHLGRLRYRTTSFPFESLASVAAGEGVALADADWLRLRRLFDQWIWARGHDRVEDAIGLLEQGLALAAEQPQLLIELGRLQRTTNDLRSAERTLGKFVQLEPGDVFGQYLLALILRDAGKSPEALETLEIVVKLDPDMPGPLNDMAWILAAHPDASVRDPSRAVTYGRRAAELTRGRDPIVLGTLAAAYAAEGDFQTARDTARSALRIAPPRGEPGVTIERHLALYRDGRAVIDSGLQPRHPRPPLTTE